METSATYIKAPLTRAVMGAAAISRRKTKEAKTIR
jgi:hypothetical protein